MVTEAFGQFVRRKREAKGLGLREMARRIGVSPTYLSKIERDEFAPPVEEKVRKIAEIIGCNADELLARAGRVPSSTAVFFKNMPVETAELVRNMSAGKFQDGIRRARIFLGDSFERDLVLEIGRLSRELKELRKRNRKMAESGREKTTAKKKTKRKGPSHD